MPSTSFDTFFACTIIVMAVLIATACLATTLQARIATPQDSNKDVLLKSVADRMITYPGSPSMWGVFQMPPAAFGLAKDQSTGTYELDIDKISRLYSGNQHSLSYIDLLRSTQLTDIAFSISIRQVMDVTTETSSIQTIGDETHVTLSVSTKINHKAAGANLSYYIIADNYFDKSPIPVATSGTYDLTVSLPNDLANQALVVIFARAECDERITSYAVYNLSEQKQETQPSQSALDLSPQGYTLEFNNSAGITVQNVYMLTYSYASNVTSIGASGCEIPRLIDCSPYVLLACGEGANRICEWVSYPPVPLSVGSSFGNNERYVYSYLVTIEGVLYQAEISLGDINA